MLFNTPYWLRMLGGKGLTWDIPTDGNELYLTFDDGPDPVTTPVILDILKQYDAKGTFFCVGENVDKHPDIYQMILSGKKHPLPPTLRKNEALAAQSPKRSIQYHHVDRAEQGLRCRSRSGILPGENLEIHPAGGYHRFSRSPKDPGETAICSAGVFAKSKGQWIFFLGVGRWAVLILNVKF